MKKVPRFDSILHLFLVLLVAIIIVPVIAVYSFTYSGLVERLHSTYNTLAQVASDTATASVGEAMDSISGVSLAVIGNDRICSFLTKNTHSDDFLSAYTSAYSDVETYCRSEERR